MRTSRTRLTLCVSLLALSSITYAAEVSVPSLATGPGSSISLSIMFDPQGSSLSGIQFDLQYDNSNMTIVATPGEASGVSGKSIYLNEISPNRLRFLVAGLNQNVIGAGPLLSLLVNLAPNTLGGSYSLMVSGATGTDALGNASPVAGSNGTITVEGTSGSRIQAAGVLNGASLTAGPVAPGEIVTLIGSSIGPAAATVPTPSASSTNLGGVSVLIGGNPAPLLYAGPNQINAIIPYEIAGANSAQMFIMNNGELVAGFPLTVSAAMPAIFTVQSTGVGPGAILNQDSSLNSPSNPALRGSVVVLFATGAGTMNPTQTDGQVTGANSPVPSLPVSVQIGGVNAAIAYAGAAPGLVAGVLQVNCVVPQNIEPNETTQVQLTIGTISSPAGVTLAIE